MNTRDMYGCLYNQIDAYNDKKSRRTKQKTQYTLDGVYSYDPSAYYDVTMDDESFEQGRESDFGTDEKYYYDDSLDYEPYDEKYHKAKPIVKKSRHRGLLFVAKLTLAIAGIGLVGELSCIAYQLFNDEINNGILNLVSKNTEMTRKEAVTKLKEDHKILYSLYNLNSTQISKLIYTFTGIDLVSGAISITTASIAKHKLEQQEENEEENDEQRYSSK